MVLNPYLHAYKTFWMTVSAVKVTLLCTFCDTNSYIYIICSYKNVQEPTPVWAPMEYDPIVK